MTRLIPLSSALATACLLAGSAPAAQAAYHQTAPAPKLNTQVSVRLAGEPANPTSSTTATFSFSATGSTSTACSLDGAAYVSCTSPVTYTGLAAGKHSFSVRATGKTTATTSYAWTIDTTPPSAPSNLAAQGQSQQVYLTWTASSDPDSAVAGYSVYRNGTRVAQTTQTNYVDGGLTNGAGYSYYVVAYDAAGNLSPASGTVSATPATVSPLGVSGNWTLKFDDEFDGSSLNLNKWQPDWLGSSNTQITTPPNGQDLNCMDPKQVSVSGGYLSLAAAARSCTASNGTTFAYASGLVNSYSHYTFTYGYAEARVYIPASSTGTPVNFPAFWANGTGTWPTTGELDVTEVLGDCGPGLGFHFHSSLGAFGGCATMPVSTGWHTFGANWQSGVVTYYYDGQPVGQVTQGITGYPMYLILNNSIDPTYGGPTLTPANLQVDYVRVWQ